MDNFNLKIIKIIKTYILNDTNLNKLFNHHNQKYLIDDLLMAIIIILTKGIPYRDISRYTNINWNTVYKFKMKLINYNIMEKVFHNIVKLYLIELDKPSKILCTDTSLIINKLGIDMISNNPQLKKHKTTKISIITDDFNVPLDVNIYNSNSNDAAIFYNQLDELYKNNPILCTDNNILLGDAAYDSNKIRNKMKELKLGNILTGTNLRNTKDINKINERAHTFKEKMVLKTRIRIEHIINIYKKFKRLHIRYDKYVNNYKSYLYFASIIIIIRKTNMF